MLFVPIQSLHLRSPLVKSLTGLSIAIAPEVVGGGPALTGFDEALGLVVGGHDGAGVRGTAQGVGVVTGTGVVGGVAGLLGAGD